MARDITVHFVGNARDLAASAALAGESVERFGHKVELAGAQSAAASAGFTLAGTAFEDAASQAMGLGAALSSIEEGMPPLIPVAIAYATALSVALAPALAYTLGLASALSLALGGLAGFGLIAAGFTFLTVRSQGWLTAADNLKRANDELAKAQEAVGQSAKPTTAQLDRLADAQQGVAEAAKAADNPWTNFVNRLNQAADNLGKLFLPQATSLLKFLTDLVDPVEQAGAKLIEWFGPRLEPTLKVARQFFDDVLEALERLGKRVGPFFDELIKHPARYEAAFTQALNAIIEVIGGLLSDLDQLAKWWGRHPEMQRDAEVTFRAIGAAIDIAIRSLERMAEDADWVYQNLRKLWNLIHGGGFQLPLESGSFGAPGHGLQHGGFLPPGGWARVGEVAEEVAYALPGGGMAVMPLGGGRGGGGSGATYNVNVSVSPLASPADVGRQVVAAIQEYERRGSAAWRGGLGPGR